MNIAQFRYGSDNLGYVLYCENRAVAIDPGAADEILAFAKDRGLQILFAANTHSHPDHTAGNRKLLENTGAEYLDFQKLISRGEIRPGPGTLQVIHTPGHTSDSVCFYAPPVLVSGDTLFNGKVGRCFTGDTDTFLESIKKLVRLPDETMIYPGHDYVEEYAGFIRALEPDSPWLDYYLEKYDPSCVASTLADEKKVNPFLRINEEKIASILRSRGLAADTEIDRWRSLISIM